MIWKSHFLPLLSIFRYTIYGVSFTKGNFVCDVRYIFRERSYRDKRCDFHWIDIFQTAICDDSIYCYDAIQTAITVYTRNFIQANLVEKAFWMLLYTFDKEIKVFSVPVLGKLKFVHCHQPTTSAAAYLWEHHVLVMVCID